MIGLYVFVIIVANVITAMFPPLHWFDLIIPCGSFLVGITFFLRDFIQLRIGKTNIYKLILLSAGISGVISILFGDPLNIAVASVVSFFVSEAFDTEVFTRIGGSFKKRMVISGLFGGILDSTIFVVLALSPIASGILPWESVPNAILGQMLIKCCMQFLVLPILRGVD